MKIKSYDQNLLEQAYLKVRLNEESIDIIQVAKQLEFKPTTKKKILYKFL